MIRNNTNKKIIIILVAVLCGFAFLLYFFIKLDNDKENANNLGGEEFNNGYLLLTSEGFPPEKNEEIINHAYITTDKNEIKRIKNDYKRVDQNHACGYTHSVQFWSDRNILELDGYFNEDVSCGGRSLTNLVKKLSDSPTHFIYNIRVPSSVTIQQLDKDLKNNAILSFMDLNDLIHLPHIDLTLEVYFPMFNEFSYEQKQDFSTAKIDELISEVQQELKVEFVDYTHCSSFSYGRTNGCITCIRFRLTVEQDIEEAEEYLKNKDQVEINTVSNHENYVVKIYHESDDINVVRDEIKDKINYIIEVEEYKH